MSLSPTMWCGGTLVIFDGPKRLAWSTTPPGQWSPISLWPTPRQAERVVDRLRAGGNVLVLMEQDQTSVPMFVEEAMRFPGRSTARMTTDGVITELHIPALDWLPGPLRDRGLRFLRETASSIRQRPDLLLPHLLVDEPGQAPDNLRFARIRSPHSFTDDRLRSAVDHLFAPTGERHSVPGPLSATMEKAS